MCLATPGKVIEIKGEWATVQSDNHTHKASLSLVKNVKLGDYVLVHGDLAINKVEKKEANHILKMINKLNCHEHK